MHCGGVVKSRCKRVPATDVQNRIGSDIPRVISGLSSVMPNALEKLRNTSRVSKIPAVNST